MGDPGSRTAPLRSTWISAACAIASLAAVADPARADDTGKGEALLAEATEHMRKATSKKANEETRKLEYTAATVALERVRALTPDKSGPYYWLVISYAATARCDEAIAAMNDYVSRRRRENKEPKEDASKALQRDCRAGMLKVVTKPPGAEVRLDGAEGAVRGTAPLVLHVAAGDHKVHLTLAGHEPQTAEVTIEAKGQALVQVVLPPASEATQVPAQPPVAGQPGAENPGAAAQPSAGADPAVAAAPPPAPATSPVLEPFPNGPAPPEAAPAAPAPAATTTVASAPTGARKGDGDELIAPMLGSEAAPTDPLVARLAVTVSVQPATVYVDGIPAMVNRGADEREVPPGFHDVIVEAAGYAPARARIVLRAGERRVYLADLRKIQDHVAGGLGGMFLAFGVVGGGMSLFSHFLAEGYEPGSDDYVTAKKIELGGAITAGISGATAIALFIVDGVTNRRRVRSNVVLPLTEVTEKR